MLFAEEQVEAAPQAAAEEDEDLMTVFMSFISDHSEEVFHVQPGDGILHALEKTLVGSRRHFKYRVYFCEELIEDEESTFEDYGIEDGARLVVEEATIKTGIMGGIHLQIETATYGPAPHPLGGPVSTEAHRLSPVWMAVQTNMPSLGVKRSGAYTVWYRGAQVDAEETRFCDLEDIGSYTRIELKPAAPGSVPMSR